MESGAPLDGRVVEWMRRQRWFAGRTRSVRAARVLDRIPVATAMLVVVAVDNADASDGGSPYVLALDRTPDVVDAFENPAFCRALLDLVRRNAGARGERGALAGWRGPAFPADLPAEPPAHRLGGEQSNTSVTFGDTLIMKVFRRLSDGINPDLEITRFLTEQTAFRGTPRLAGALEYHDGARATLAVVQEFVPGARDGWRFVLERLVAGDDTLHSLGRLGTLTADLHRALATPTSDPAFGVESITAADVAAWSEAVGRQVEAARAAAPERALPDVPDAAEALAGLVGCVRIRHHGDFHLGQTLAVDDGRDFRVIDFEGEPLRPIEERRRKHTPLRDVAGMLRSLGYAAATALPPARRTAWERAAREVFVAAYRRAAGAAAFVPASEAGFVRAVAALEVEKAAYEIVYEARHRPDWIEIPLAGFVSAASALRPRAGAA